MTNTLNLGQISSSDATSSCARSHVAAREKTEIKLFPFKLQPKQIRKRCSLLCVGVEGTEASPSQARQINVERTRH